MAKSNDMLSRKLNDPEAQAQILEENNASVLYEIDGQLRRVPPYFYTYLTFCKQRWIGQPLLEVFANEFREKSFEYYKTAIANGQVKVNNKVVDCSYVLLNGDLITHRAHKHEPPVSCLEPKIVFENEDICVIDKPGGVPVHPTGRFNHNSVMTIMQKTHNLKLNPCNRLDRLTSGLMFMAKNAKGANDLSKQIRERTVKKEYLALVNGHFPASSELESGISTVDPKVALNMVDEDGKYSRTKFLLVSYDSKANRSLVLCEPLTGRTHQIRVHLQYLGFPIANDPIYANLEAWDQFEGGKGATKQTTDYKAVALALDAVGKTRAAHTLAFPNANGEILSGQECEICATPLYTDPGPNDLDLWLHALKYQAKESEGSPAWSYETEIPIWALNLHSKFMELALECAQKCPDIEGAFAVGAVLVHNGEVLETGYTRELEGNTHAEQNALIKWAAKGQPLPLNTVLYTTMEPCTFRLSGNKPCAERVLNEPAIKTVFVGVLEPSTFVANNTSKSKLEEGGVIYLKLPGFADRALKIAEKGHKKD